MNAPDRILSGLMLDLPASVYHAHEALSASGAKKLLQSPQHYKLMRDTPNEPTEAMEFGTAVHTLVLEPDKAGSTIAVVGDINRRTKEGKAEWLAFQQEHHGKVILKLDDFKRASACAANVLAHPGAAKLLGTGDREASMFWTDPKTGVPCKLRTDLMSFGGFTDLKTTQDASPEAFGRSCASFFYHVQAAHYINGGIEVMNEEARFFIFIAVESEPPHGVAVYAMDDSAILAGRQLLATARDRYAEALASGRWKGYPETIERLIFPRYSLKLHAY